MKWQALAAAAALAASAAGAAPVDLERLAAHIRTLSSDAFEGRGVGEAGETRTLEYLSREFAKAGFQPGGADGGWTQAVKLLRMEMREPRIQLRTGDGPATALTQGERIVVSTRRPADAILIEEAPILFVGYGITAPERGWDDFKGVSLRGKIALFLVNDADAEAPELATFDGKGMTYYGRWTYKFEEAARRGALGAIVIHEEAMAGYGWGTVKSTGSGPIFDIRRNDPAAERVTLEGWMQRDLAAELFARAGLSFEDAKKRAQSRDFVPVDLGSRLSVSARLDVQEIETRNLIARLPGRKRPDETFLYTAHWDHLGRGEPGADGDAIYNGAIDNATGIAALLELARRFGAGPRPERSILMIAFTAEEKGILGSEYYAANPVHPLERTVGGINMDGLMNLWGPSAEFGIVGSGKHSLEEDFAKAARRQGRRFTGDTAPEFGVYFRSDHFPLAKRGVPMIYGSGGPVADPKLQKAEEQWREEYFQTKYHQPDDEWNARWDLRGIAQDLELYYRVGLDLANSRRWPEWASSAEFRQVREASSSARARPGR